MAEGPKRDKPQAKPQYDPTKYEPFKFEAALNKSIRGMSSIDNKIETLETLLELTCSPNNKNGEPVGYRYHPKDLVAKIRNQSITINHLQDQVKVLPEFKKEVGVLKADNDRMAKMIDDLSLGAPSTSSQAPSDKELMELGVMEKKRKIKERSMQTLIRDLWARASKQTMCGTTCQKKLFEKNQQITLYRAELERIIEALWELKCQR